MWASRLVGRVERGAGDTQNEEHAHNIDAVCSSNTSRSCRLMERMHGIGSVGEFAAGGRGE